MRRHTDGSLQCVSALLCLSLEWRFDRGAGQFGTPLIDFSLSIAIRD